MSPGKTILIVEDDSDVRESLAVFLEGEGYSVVEAEHGKEALRCLRSSTDFCLILLDLFMPVMNGWRFVTSSCAIRAWRRSRSSSFRRTPGPRRRRRRSARWTPW